MGVDSMGVCTRGALTDISLGTDKIYVKYGGRMTLGCNDELFVWREF